MPKRFRELIREVFERNEFKPKDEGDSSTLEDTPRNRCLGFKHLAHWEN